MNNLKTRTIIIAILGLYAVGLSLASFYFFGQRQQQQTTPPLPETGVTAPAAKAVSVSISPLGDVILDTGGQAVEGFQTKIILPYDSKYLAAKIETVGGGFRAILQSTDVDIPSGLITFSLALIWDNGFTSSGPTTLARMTVAGQEISGNKLSFDKKFTKVLPYKGQGNLPITYE